MERIGRGASARVNDAPTRLLIGPRSAGPPLIRPAARRCTRDFGPERTRPVDNGRSERDRSRAARFVSFIAKLVAVAREASVFLLAAGSARATLGLNL